MGIRKNTRYTIRIPDKINLFYSETKKIIIFKGPQTQKSLKIKTKLDRKKMG